MYYYRKIYGSLPLSWNSWPKSQDFKTILGKKSTILTMQSYFGKDIQILRNKILKPTEPSKNKRISDHGAMKFTTFMRLLWLFLLAAKLSVEAAKF